jgi:hypothetical protein
VPVAYNESANGDLQAGGTLPIMAFDLGVNTVVGVTSVGAMIDFDSFAFSVPAGMQISSATLETEFVDVFMPGFFSGAQWAFNKGTNIYGNGQLQEVPTMPATAGGTPYTFTSLPQGEGIYNLSQAVLSASNGLGQYRYTFNVVAAVPESATLIPLAAAGALAATLGLRRRQNPLPLRGEVG